MATFKSVLTLGAAIAPLLVNATPPDMQFQRRAYKKYNDNLKLRLKRGIQDGGMNQVLKPGFTPPPAILPIVDVNTPNSTPGINTPDNM